MIPRPRISFGKIAHRVGAVTLEDLDKARQIREEQGGSLEEILVEMEAMTPELVEFTREAFIRACAVCEECGRRTDVVERESGDWGCRCGGTFVTLEEALEEDAFELNPDLFRSEDGSVSDVGPVEPA